ncbi:uncharacterized protein STEHIDRAFT_164045 [Stereum hirsutum FP-91666 SS1]|uniref:Uncharacterized protein n=1 Tax=Stereum hirsutum (strain FP-91666) TaxID=721885 RepID=R7RWB8_STEHR|nr:uncharacterized protein STEHIDRAFT_164045 [Stereum hirsutum FP-91666 SS1]EIM79065.1 hypothetical protein STEHIDRAFT_164045 [Stereum hirsutum FP-91666 SS1]
MGPKPSRGTARGAAASSSNRGTGGTGRQTRQQRRTSDTDVEGYLHDDDDGEDPEQPAKGSDSEHTEGSNNPLAQTPPSVPTIPANAEKISPQQSGEPKNVSDSQVRRPESDRDPDHSTETSSGAHRAEGASGLTETGRDRRSPERRSQTEADPNPNRDPLVAKITVIVSDARKLAKTTTALGRSTAESIKKQNAVLQEYSNRLLDSQDAVDNQLAKMYSLMDELDATIEDDGRYHIVDQDSARESKDLDERTPPPRPTDKGKGRDDRERTASVDLFKRLPGETDADYRRRKIVVHEQLDRDEDVAEELQAENRERLRAERTLKALRLTRREWKAKAKRHTVLESGILEGFMVQHQSAHQWKETYLPIEVDLEMTTMK